MHPDFFNRQTMFQRASSSLECVDVGPSSIDHVLVHALGVGDQPSHPPAGSDLLVDAGDERKGWSKAVALVRTDLGHYGAHQSIITGLSARFRVMGLVSTLEGRQTFSGWNRSGLRCIRRLHRPVADSQLPYVWTICVSAFELRCGTPHWQWTRSERYVDGVSPPHTKCF